MKQIMFQGNMYNVPEWAKWIARDGAEYDGDVYAFRGQPRLVADEWLPNGRYVKRVFIVQPEEAFPVECMPIPSEDE